MKWDAESEDEYAEFYDFESMWEAEDETEASTSYVYELYLLRDRMHITEAGEVVLADGKIVGNREFVRYYKQRAPRVDNRESTRALRVYGSTSDNSRVLAVYTGMGYMPARSSAELPAFIQRKQNEYNMKLGIKGNLMRVMTHFFDYHKRLV